MHPNELDYGWTDRPTDRPIDRPTGRPTDRPSPPQLTAKGVRALLESFRSSPSSDGGGGGGDRLSCLELDFNPIGDTGAQPFVAYLKQRAAGGGGGLEELSLRFCDIGPAGCRYVPAGARRLMAVC